MTKQDLRALSILHTDHGDQGLCQRSEPRLMPLRTHCLTLTVEDRFLVCRLVDYSSKGLGLDTFEPLSVGATVLISGTVQVGDVWMEVKGPAAVAHCGYAEDELFRVGLEFDGAEWSETVDPGRTPGGSAA